MTLIDRSNALNDFETFQRVVKPRNSMRTGGYSALILGALVIIARAVASAFVASDYGVPWIDAFLNAQFEGRRTALLLNLAFWVGIPLIVLGIVLVVLSYTRGSKELEKVHARYQNGGYVAQQAAIGYQVKIPKQAAIDAALLTHPSLTDQQFSALLTEVRGRIAAADRKALRPLGTLLAGAQGTGAPLTAFYPDLTVPNLLVQSAPNEYVVVVPAAKAGGKPALYYTNN